MGKAPAVTGLGEGWSEWKRLTGLPPFSPAVLAETLDGGQAFRWHATADGTWTGTWSRYVVQARLRPDAQLEWSAPREIAAEVESAFLKYFASDVDFAALADALPWRSDPHLARCVAAFPQLRILRQPFGETLLGFLCSATKQIVQIKQMVGLLAVRHGRLLVEPSPTRLARIGGSDSVPTSFFRLPTWPELAHVPEAELRKCLLGFRARYIAETARFLAAHPGWLDDTEQLPYAAAKARLCTLPGVGEKVADCVLLFGAGRLEAFPVDVWILKTLARRYALEGWKPSALVQFGRAHFGEHAGLAQQFLFAWERAEARAARSLSASG